jgi:MFS family permease
MLLVRNRNYRLVFSASAISNLGDGVSALALPWLATLFTRDAFLISLVAMAGRLPWFLFALPAGVLTDRGDRRRLMVRADFMRLVLTLMVVALALSPGTGSQAIIALTVLTFLLGSAEVLRDNAAQTLLPSIVDKADLESANGQMWSAEQVMGQFIGPPLAGLLIALGIAVPFGFDAASFAIAALLIWMVALPPRIRRPGAPFLTALREGIDWMRGHPVILRLALMLGIINAGAIACMTIFVLYAQEILRLGPFGSGLLLAAGAAGGVAGGLTGPGICRRAGLRRSMIIGLIAFMAAYLIFALTTSPVLAGVALAVEALGAMIWNIATVSYRQRQIPDAILGRVNSIYRFFGWGAMPLGAVLGGSLVAWSESPLGRETALRLPFALASVTMCLVLIYALTRLRTD